VADSADRAQVNPGGTPAGYEKLLEQLKAPGDNPPQFSTMHRPGIAKVTGNRIVLDGTTVEEFTRAPQADPRPGRRRHEHSARRAPSP